MTEEYDDFRAIVEGSPDAIFVVRAGRIAFVNPAAVQLAGHANAASLRGLPIVDLFDPGSRSLLKTCIDSARSSGRPAQLDASINRPDGGVVQVAVAAARLGAPEEAAVQVVLRDITERKADETALRESEERLALAVAGARAGVWDWDLQTNSVVYSSRWKQMLGYSDEEIERNLSAWERLVHPDDRHLADEAKAVLARAEQTYEVELRLRHKDGHYVHVLSRGYPVRSSDGTVVRVVGTMLDLTERKQVEAALRESEERLRLAFAGAQEGDARVRR